MARPSRLPDIFLLICGTAFLTVVAVMLVALPWKASLLGIGWITAVLSAIFAVGVRKKI